MALSRRNRYAKSLTGLNAIGFFSPVAAYTSATTYAGFVQTAPASTNGTLAIIAYPTMAVQTTGLAAGSQFFIAQVLDNDIKKSPIMTHNGNAASVTNYVGPNFFLKKTTYTAPVLAQQTAGYNGTSGDLGLTAGTVSNPITYVFSARDITPANQPFPTQVATVFSQYSTATNVKFEITSALAADFSNSLDYQTNSDTVFAYCDVLCNGTGTQVAGVTGTFIAGSTTVTFSGAHSLTLAASYAIRIGSAATGQCYKIIAVPSTTTITIDRPFQPSMLAVGTPVLTTASGGVYQITVANVPTITQTGLQVTAATEDCNFILSYASIPANLYTNTTPWLQGSGAAWQVALMEQDTAVMSGFTNANYPWIQDIGTPTFFVPFPAAETSTVQYTLYFIKYRNVTESFAFPNEQVSPFAYIIVACPNSGGPDTTVSTVLLGV